MFKRLTPFVTAVLLLSTVSVGGQLFEPPLKVPTAEALSAARKSCVQLFDNLKTGDTQAVADWIVSEIGHAFSEADRITKRNEFKSKMDLVIAGPPASPYGKIDGYDLIDEAYLPGTDRYFRFVYMSYHQRAPLVWEFRFYVKPDGKAALNFITWSEKNPFEYMSTSDMRLPAWVHK